MGMAQALLREFEHEMATTRRLLEIIPGGEAGWRPHPRSYTLGELGVHLATIPYWGQVTFEQTEFDVEPPGSGPVRAAGFTSVDDLLRRFDENVRGARNALAASSDADLAVTWMLRKRGATVFALPRAAVFRSFVMSHLIHHRGQLTVYLRLRDVPLPPVYGPTADVAG